MKMELYQWWFEENRNHWIAIHPNIRSKMITHLESHLDTIMSIYHESLQLPFTSDIVIHLSHQSIRSRIIAILCLDQFSRNLQYKYYNIKPFLSQLTRKSLLYSFSFFENDQIYQLTSDELIFILMPFKHLHIDALSFVDRIIKSYLNYHHSLLIDESHSRLQAFYIDYVRKYFQKYTQVSIFTETCPDVHELQSVCEIDTLHDDWKSLTYSFSDTLDVRDHIVLDFLKQNCITGRICVSLSGGVDSQVLLYILKRISNVYPIEPVAFHLYYGNRNVAELERLVVSEYCQKLGISLYSYDIPFIRRREIAREPYENITRDIRFECYRQMACPIVMGHIKDDVLENIFTNMSANRNLFHLGKIEPISTQKNVILLRPFLDIEKIDIYDYASRHRIPYLLNTTPILSNRGKFRNNFLPSYLEQFGENGIDSIHEFASQLRQYGNIITKTLIQPKIQTLLNGGTIEFTQEELDNYHYVREIFTGYCHIKGSRMPSEKIISDFIERYRRQLIQPQNHMLKFPIRQNVVLYIKGGNIFVK